MTQYQSPNCVKALFGAQANHNVTENATGNNLLHLAAKHSTDLGVLEYVLKNAKSDIFARNTAGATVLSLCQSTGN